MNRIFFITLLIIWLTSCDLDYTETTTKNDTDDMNVINLIWNQAIDNAVKLYYDTNTRAS